MSSSSVCIATDYGLDGPGSNPSVDEIFLLSRLALGPTQPPIKRTPVLSRGLNWLGRGANPATPIYWRGPRKSRVIPLLTLGD